jgi:hypothetical protein
VNRGLIAITASATKNGDTETTNHNDVQGTFHT